MMGFELLVGTGAFLAASDRLLPSFDPCNRIMLQKIMSGILHRCCGFGRNSLLRLRGGSRPFIHRGIMRGLIGKNRRRRL